MKFKSMVAALSLPAAAWAGIALDQPIQLSVDATRAPERRFRAHSVLAVTPGPLTLVYPKWIPGEHGPTGPIGNIAGLRFRAGGRDLAWQRDSVDMFAFHLAVPPGASRLEVAAPMPRAPPVTMAMRVEGVSVMAPSVHPRAARRPA